MQKEAEIFDSIVQQRRSIRIYEDEEIPTEVVERSLQRALLSPNSSNLQLWEFYRVKSKDKLKELAHYCLDQNSAKTAKELIVVVTRKDKWRKHATYVLDAAKASFPPNIGKKEKLITDYYNKIIPTLYFSDPLDITGKGKQILSNTLGIFRPTPREVSAHDIRVVVHKSAALAAQTFMLSIKAEGYDSCPMEGFDSKRVKNMLQLPAAAEICMIISVGKAKPEGVYGNRMRIDSKEIIFEV
jgi:nitroreductase